MSITWDAPLTAATAAALARRLGTGRDGARLRAYHLDHHAGSLLLWFRDATVAFRLAPATGAILLLDPAEPLDEARPLASTLEAVEVPPDDRVLLLSVRKVRGGRAPFLLAVELITNHWNVVVAEGEDRRIRHLLDERAAGGRRFSVGDVYEPPEPSSRVGRSGDIPLEGWLEILEPVEPERRRAVLLSRVAWTSSINAEALLGDAGRTTGPPARSALEEGYRVWRTLADVGTAPSSAASPVLLETPGGPHPYPVSLPGLPARPVGGLLEAFRLAAEEGEGGVTTAIPSAWMRALEKRADRARGKVKGLSRELEEAPDPDDVRALGDLLLARYDRVRKGMDSVRLPDFEGGEVEVELDPKLGPEENASRYYDRAARAERARKRLPAMIDEAAAEVRRLEALVERVRAGEVDPQEVRRELPESDDDGKGPREASPSLPYRSYRSTGGLEIRVGLGPARNDDLTFHHSRPDDVWLHARHTAGAHVILRWDGEGNPPSRDLAEAAVLAALHSKARTSGSVPVDWTLRKYVRKPRKAKPGTVVPDRVSTVFVEPDERVEERLRKRARSTS